MYCGLLTNQTTIWHLLRQGPHLHLAVLGDGSSTGTVTCAAAEQVSGQQEWTASGQQEWTARVDSRQANVVAQI